MNVLLGISASGGIGIGNAFVLPETPERVIYKNRISDEEVEYEWSRFESACLKVKESIEKSLSGLSQEDLNRVILETYLLMLADPVFLQEVKASFEILNIPSARRLMNMRTA